MRSGEIYYANLSPVVGSEIDKPRPVLVVSNDANNHAASTVTILPITSNVSRVYPFEVLLTSEDSHLPKPSAETLIISSTYKSFRSTDIGIDVGESGLEWKKR